MAKKEIEKNIPKGWSVKKIKNVLSFEQPGKYIVESTAYTPTGKTPVLTANKSFILGYTDEDFGIYKNIPAIIFDDFTTDSKYVNFNFKIKSSAIKILKTIDESTNLKFIYEIIKSIDFPIESHKRHYISQYQEQEIVIPLLLEQEKIAEILSSVDSEIQAVDSIISETEKLKGALMHDLFTKGIGHNKFKKTKIGNIPQDWEILKMQDICTVRQGLQIAISSRFKDYQVGRYKYITLKNLKDNSYEYIDSPKKSVICSKDDVLMTRTGNTGVVVTNVEGVFHNNFFLIDFDRKKINKDFLVYFFLRDGIKKIVLEKAGTTTIPDLNHGAFYSIDFIIPSMDEQNKIVEILNTVYRKISINKELKEKLKELKKGLMSDLLSGKVRTI